MMRSLKMALYKYCSYNYSNSNNLVYVSLRCWSVVKHLFPQQ